MTITPRIGVSAIEFVRSKDGSEEREIVCVPLDVCKKLLIMGASRYSMMPTNLNTLTDNAVLTILRQEAEK